MGPFRFVRPVVRVATAGLVMILALASGCSQPTTPNPVAAADVPAALRGFYDQKLAWSSCDTIFQCASLRVPLDYTRPGGGTITLAVVRKQATDPAHRIGSLITNPGGPGASGVEFVKQGYPAHPRQPSHFGPQLRAGFDIVGFDPRGVGQSAPVTCLSDTQLDQFMALDRDPTTPAAQASAVTGARTFDAGCQAHSAALLPYVGTPNTARDMDILRAVLGDRQMYYLGISYGTYLGAVYAELFPTHLARAVFDAPVPPTLTAQQLGIAQAGGFQDALTRFIADCVTHSDCPLGTDPKTAGQKLADFFVSAQAHPLPTGTGRRLNETLAKGGVLVAMYRGPRSWPILRHAMAMAMAGDGRELLTLSDQSYTRDPQTGHYPNQPQAYIAISCLDHPHVHSVDDLRTELPGFERASPLMGAFRAWKDLPCAYWPIPAQTQPHTISYAGSPPILVVGTTHDPATPYPGAQAMAAQLGSAVLLTYNGDGHIAYGRGGSCIDTAVDAYLTRGTVPGSGTVCQPDSATATSVPTR
ncbi:MAG: alpha/beta hydrolase [Pseudonocardiaceae bacterium]